MAKIEVDITDEMLNSMKILAESYLKNNLSKESALVFKEREKSSYEELAISIGYSVLNEIMVKAIEEKMKEEKK